MVDIGYGIKVSKSQLNDLNKVKISLMATGLVDNLFTHEEKSKKTFSGRIPKNVKFSKEEAAKFKADNAVINDVRYKAIQGDIIIIFITNICIYIHSLSYCIIKMNKIIIFYFNVHRLCFFQISE